ncbi:hypothetical protein M5689_011343 [Euphorbia peplus]|nr:hypothetical protein M5689_011343 [Euphorbia peplus]
MSVFSLVKIKAQEDVQPILVHIENTTAFSATYPSIEALTLLQHPSSADRAKGSIAILDPSEVPPSITSLIPHWNEP